MLRFRCWVVTIFSIKWSKILGPNESVGLSIVDSVVDQPPKKPHVSVMTQNVKALTINFDNIFDYMELCIFEDPPLDITQEIKTRFNR